MIEASAIVIGVYLAIGTILTCALRIVLGPPDDLFEYAVTVLAWPFVLLGTGG